MAVRARPTGVTRPTRSLNRQTGASRRRWLRFRLSPVSACQLTRRAGFPHQWLKYPRRPVRKQKPGRLWRDDARQRQLQWEKSPLLRR